MENNLDSFMQQPPDIDADGKPADKLDKLIGDAKLNAESPREVIKRLKGESMVENVVNSKQRVSAGGGIYSSKAHEEDNMRIKNRDLYQERTAVFTEQFDLEAAALQFNFPKDINLDVFPNLPEEWLETSIIKDFGNIETTY